jgi:heme o synthase
VKNAQVGAAPAIAVGRRATGRLGDFVALAKPRLNVLVVASSAAGYYLGSPSAPEFTPMALAVGGTAFVAGGAAVLNQVYERDTDALMMRTRLRPLPDRRVGTEEARAFGIALAAAGLGILMLSANLLAALVAAATLVIYLAVYTPLKRRSAISTLVGAVPGALPPLIGYASMAGTLSRQAWVLFAILFVWQLPHFYSIAWLHRDDYARGGMRMLPVVDHRDGRLTGWATALTAGVLLAVTAAPFTIGAAGWVYLVGAMPLGVWFLARCVRFARVRSQQTARTVLRGSLVYLLGVMGLLVVDGVLPRYFGG